MVGAASSGREIYKSIMQALTVSHGGTGAQQYKLEYVPSSYGDGARTARAWPRALVLQWDRVARLSVSSLSLPCLPCVSWLRSDAESPGLDLGTDIWRMRKELIVPSTVQPRRCPSREPREHVREDARRFRKRHELPRHAVAGLPRLAVPFTWWAYMRIVCNRKF